MTLQIKEVGASYNADTVKLLVDNSLGHQRIVIPLKFENQIIDHYHFLNYPGVKATQRFITARFVFHAMRRKIRDRVRACTGCQRSKVYRHVVSPIASCKIPTARLDTVHTDLCGPYPECQEFFYLLVYIDRFSRFVTTYSLCNIQTESVIIGMNAYISTFGQMRVLRVDNGVQWCYHFVYEPWCYHFVYEPWCYHFVPEHHASSRTWLFTSRAHVFPKLTTTWRHFHHTTTTSIFTTDTRHYASNESVLQTLLRKTTTQFYFLQINRTTSYILRKLTKNFCFSAIAFLSFFLNKNVCTIEKFAQK